MSDHELEAKLRCIEWPVPVRHWKVEKGADATGDDAVWVWVTLEDQGADIVTRSELRHKVRDAVADFEDPGPYWVYVRFDEDPELEAQ